MKRTRTIRFRLSMALLQVFVLIAMLALVSLWRLSDYHRTADDIHDRYLPGTQVLGDLSTLTADFRTLEAAALLSATEAGRRADRTEIDKIDNRIADLLASYDESPPPEALLPFYRSFTDLWRDYRALAAQTLALAGTQPDKAVALFRSGSHDAYEAAADALWILAARNRMAADEASRRTERSYEQALWLTIAGTVLGGVVLLGGIIHIRRAILLPLARLATAMRRLAANDMEIGPLETSRGDEIAEMAQAVEIFRQNAVALTEKLAQEQRLAELQRNVVAMASHEFRTPLTIIDGHAQRLINRRDKSNAAEVDERAGKIRQAVARMTGVIGSLIESARLIDAPEADFALFDLAELLAEACQFHRDMASHARIVEQISGPLMMNGDSKLMFQLFSNLLSNATKYSSEDGTVRIEAERRCDELAVRIADQGVGIPAEDRDRVFERYFRGSNVAGTVGTGIGLHLVRIILDLHGGEIAVESREGEGTLFTVSLPGAAL
jgi:signal transduction histidine kinase